ncbi:MAG: hypothetical protein H6537_01700 [Bacteroidales bacterium]|nr:hypothetical protein [Bacteroidales bacterium]HPD95534.1 FtsL-like putative cell division protein [Tenuifilaceae bacterium]HRX31133.1 FtsL-like putative cell division protein [Tenuifilaceae bacterium]
MSILNNTEEFVDVQPEISQEKKKVRVKDFLSGKILTHETITAQMPYLLFLVILAVIYITNNYYNNKLIREEQKIKKEVKNLRAESITTAAQYMSISRQSAVVNMVKEKGLGLEENTTPPKKIE